jgi:TolB-like protein/Tfp pilus assembly protein PilF
MPAKAYTGLRIWFEALAMNAASPPYSESDRNQVLAQLERIVASPLFAASSRLTAFLNFVVHTTLDGKAAELKESVIGVEVFEKKGNYSPREDPVVRVMAGRLRSKLAEYYQRCGASDPVIIELPRGSYVPQFVWRRLARGGQSAEAVQPSGPSAEPALAAATQPMHEQEVNARLRVWPAAPVVMSALLMAALGWGVWYVLVPSRPVSLAVIPLENLGSDPEQEYFTDAITDVLITELARIRDLRVISRTSVLRLKKTKDPTGAIGKQLGVEYIIEGTVTRAGDRVRITAQLIATATDHHVWADSYEGDPREGFALQRAAADAIARQVRVRLSRRDQERLRPARTLDPDAQDAYLRGRHLFNRRNPDTVKEATAFFRKAIDREPGWADAYLGLAESYLVMVTNGWYPAELYMPQARAVAKRALEIDPELDEAYATLGVISANVDYNWSGAERELRRAIEIRPNNATARQWLGELLSELGRSDEAIRELRRAAELDPLSPMIRISLANAWFHARRFDESLKAYREVMELFPDNVAALLQGAMVYDRVGRTREAIELLDRAISAAGRIAPALGLLCHAQAGAGNRARAAELLRELQTHDGRSPVLLATAHMALGQSDEAIDWLRKGYEQRAPLMHELIVSPFFDSLRSYPGFAEVLRKMNVPPQP